MKLTDQTYKILRISEEPLKDIELAGRTCYNSFSKQSPTSASEFVRRVNANHHGAMIEFADMTVQFYTNRGVTHELVRHRLCSFAQRSTRYCDTVKYEMEFIRPIWCEIKLGVYVDNTSITTADGRFPSFDDRRFIENCLYCEESYIQLRRNNWRKEQAREVLPNALATTIVMKGNMREWQHIFKLRCSPKAHPQMRALLTPLRDELAITLPELFTSEDN